MNSLEKKDLNEIDTKFIFEVSKKDSKHVKLMEEMLIDQKLKEREKDDENKT